MFKNCFYNTKDSTIHLWEQIDGNDLYTEIDWVPYVYVPSKESDIKTITGKQVVRRDFNNYFDYHKFQQNNETRYVYENRIKFETQFLSERYYGIPDEEIEVPVLKIYYIDIEVMAKEGFPDSNNPEDPIIAISVRDSKTNKTTTFGYDYFHLRKYTGEYEGMRYLHCENEEELLRRFLKFMEMYPCDIISGWNIWNFDLPYIINRSRVIWGEEKGKEMYSLMSPIKTVNVWKQKMSDDINIDMGGVTILDYYNVYRWYGKKLERYTLEYVSQKELGVGKLENPYGNLNELAKRDWNRYIEYNAIDCERVSDLEEKLGYIRMIQALSLLCKCSMKFYNAQTQLIEGLMLTFYRRNKLCAPHFYGGEKEEFIAAHVKDPHVGLWEWIVDIDITSSYPSHIIALNMSLETFLGKISGLTEPEVVGSVTRREFEPFKMVKFRKGRWEIVRIEGVKLKKFNQALEKGLLAIAPNGAVFTTQKEGVVSQVEKAVFFKRKEVKAKRFEYGTKANECVGVEQEKCKARERELDSLQLALKIMMNAFFGIISVPYSRYYNIHIASAITACGRHTIKMGEKFCNELLNNPTQELALILNEMGSPDKKTEFDKKDYVKYIDTDSLFVSLGEWIMDNDAYWEDRSDSEKIDWIKKISKIMERYIDDRIFDEVQLGNYNSQVLDFKIGFKQEIIAKSALFVKKKKYSYYLVDEEGVPRDELKTTGLEIVRSDSSEAIRPRLKKIMEMIVKQEPDSEISARIRKYKKELMGMTPEDLAANVGINNIRKYITNGTARKGTPWHVKGVNNYRILLKALDISDKYEDIYEGLKAKVIYVKKNPFNVDVVSFHEWPKEFDSVLQYDQHTMIEKFFINKIRTLLEPLKKEYIIDSDDSKLQVFF